MQLDINGSAIVASAELDAGLPVKDDQGKQGMRMDKDRDEAVLAAGEDGRVGIEFGAVDTSSGGGVTMDEPKAYHAKRR